MCGSCCKNTNIFKGINIFRMTLACGALSLSIKELLSKLCSRWGRKHLLSKTYRPKTFFLLASDRCWCSLQNKVILQTIFFGSLIIKIDDRKLFVLFFLVTCQGKNMGIELKIGLLLCWSIVWLKLSNAFMLLAIIDSMFK